MEMNQYLEVFIEESREHLQSCNTNLLKLEKEPENLSIVNEIFRSAHTLKGMSATMGFEDMANLTHQMENVLDGIRNGKYPVSSELLDIIFLAMDHLENMVESIAEGGDGKEDVSVVIEKLKAVESGESNGTFAEIAVSSTKDDVKEGQMDFLDYDQFELTVLEQATEQGFKTYEVTVRLRSDCLLKAARVYMVFDVLEKMGEVIKSFPTVEQLEEEQFENEFTIALITHDLKEDVKQKILKVSEIEKVDVKELDITQLKKREHEKAVEPPKKEEVPEHEKKAAEHDKTTSGTQEKKTAKLNKTIRVNIERLDALMNLFEELVIDRGRLDQIAKELKHQELSETVEKMSRVTNDLQSVVLTMRMVPVEAVFNRFPKMIRQLSGNGEKINLEISGQKRN